mgnify:CR=1 FL=1
MARLDTDHREALLESFLPRVSHQTVILATDAEAEAIAMAEPEVAPAVVPAVAWELRPAEAGSESLGGVAA